MTLFDAGALYSDRAHVDARRRRHAVSRAKMQESVAYYKKWQEDAAGSQALVRENHKTRRCGLTTGRKKRRGKIRGEFAFSEREPYSRSQYKGVPMERRAIFIVILDLWLVVFYGRPIVWIIP